MGERLGQHFLSDETVLEKIVEQIFLVRDETDIKKTIEVGPGQGALSEKIIPGFDQIVAMEADTGLKPHLNRLSKQAKTLGMSFDTLWGDVLQQDLSVFNREKGGEKNWLVVGNLPYYITSPIFRQFFVNHEFLAGTFLIQKEVGQKIVTTAKKKSYLRRLLRYTSFVEYNFTVPPTAFSPPPKVESAVVTIRRHNEEYLFSLERLQSFLEIVSPLSRKTLGKIQKMRKEQLEELGIIIDEKITPKRMEAISREEITTILTS